jgi:hypothetical protein
MIFGFAAFVVLLILWGFAWRYQTKMAFGILIGLVLGGVLAQFIGPFETIQDIPVWLPATPLISVVITLFVLGFLAWGVQDPSSEDSDNSH